MDPSEATPGPTPVPPRAVDGWVARVESVLLSALDHEPDPARRATAALLARATDAQLSRRGDDPAARHAATLARALADGEPLHPRAMALTEAAGAVHAALEREAPPAAVRPDLTLAPPATGPAGAPATADDVLLVEDDVVVAHLVRHTLEGMGLTVRTETDGALAVTRLTTPGVPVPAVVLLDWELPGMDGLTVLRRLREAGTLERTRVIMLTSRSTEHDVLAAIRGGAVDHVPKPFSVPVLVERVRRVLAG